MSTTIGDLVKNARESIDITQKQLAVKIGVDRSAINRLEHHNVGSLSTIIKVFQHIGPPAGPARDAISQRLGMTWPELAKVLGVEEGS